MNIGIYIESLGDTQQMRHISKFINSNIESLDDASIFYNDIAYNAFDVKCGIFNSTDIWNFDGTIVTPSLNCLLNVLGIVNNIKICYYYGWDKNKDVIPLINALNNNVDIICTNDSTTKELYRVTGKIPIAICDNYTNLLDILKEHDNGFSKNRKNVCRR